LGKETVLVVDDEKHIVELVKLYLEQAGFAVETAMDGAKALALFERQAPALTVLDLMLPEVDGWEVCRRIRAKSDAPILMLTARDDDVDKIVGLELGADDYMTKPFNPRELVARVKAILRRAARPPAGAEGGKPLALGALTVDPARREVTLQGKPVTLRAKEFDLLLTLAQHKGLVLTREQLLDLVWGYDFYGQTRTVDVHIAHLRNRLAGGGITIETVWGVGYKLLTD